MRLPESSKGFGAVDGDPDKAPKPVPENGWTWPLAYFEERSVRPTSNLRGLDGGLEHKHHWRFKRVSAVARFATRSGESRQYEHLFIPLPDSLTTRLIQARTADAPH